MYGRATFDDISKHRGRDFLQRDLKTQENSPKIFPSNNILMNKLVNSSLLRNDYLSERRNLSKMPLTFFMAIFEATALHLNSILFYYAKLENCAKQIRILITYLFNSFMVNFFRSKFYK